MIDYNLNDESTDWRVNESDESKCSILHCVYMYAMNPCLMSRVKLLHAATFANVLCHRLKSRERRKKVACSYRQQCKG